MCVYKILSMQFLSFSLLNDTLVACIVQAVEPRLMGFIHGLHTWELSACCKDQNVTRISRSPPTKLK